MSVDQAVSALEGKIVRPGNRLYPLVSSTYTSVNSPACVVLATGADDIRAALDVARAHGLTLTVRSGGHSLAGLSSNDGGLVLDLSAMDNVTVLDRHRRLVRVQPGARWGAVAEALAPHRLAVSSGNYGNVGVGGLATGGGIGWLARAHGLTIDHLREATVLLADGREVTASESDNPDLFWAVRGAGSQVGIVTGFTFQAAEVAAIGVARFGLRLNRERHPLVRWDQLVREAPRELTLELQMHRDTGIVTAVWAGRDRRAAATALRPFTALGPLRGGDEEFQLVRYSALVSRAQEHPNTGQQPAVTHNGMVDQVTEDLEADVLAATASGIMMQFRSLGGAIADVAPDATAFANRTQSELVIGTVFRRSDARYLETAWAPLIRAFSGAYANFETIPTEATTRLAFPEGTTRRVREVKAKYDPESVFASWPS